MVAASCTEAADARKTEHDGIGRFLVISDLHFDPYLGLSREQFIALQGASLAEWPKRLSGQPAPTRGADSPLRLLQSCLEDAKDRLPDPDFILLPGDLLSHDWVDRYDQLAARTREQDPAAYRAFTRQTMRFVAGCLREAFPKTPILPVLGNEDSDCGDYKVAPDSPFLEMITEVWSPLVFHPRVAEPAGAAQESVRRLQSEFGETVSRGGYYSVRLPGLGNHRLIALNTVFWTPQYRNACGDSQADPALDQLRWFEATLTAAARRGERVWLLMHIPPGIDSFATHRMGEVPQPLWRPEITKRFLQRVQRHRKTVQLAVAGHTHMDDFRVAQIHNQPVLLTKIVPGVSPIYGNNPGYQQFRYDRLRGAVQDYATYFLPLGLSEGTSRWKFEYEFVRAYGIPRFDAASLGGLGRKILGGGPSQAIYRQYYSVNGPQTPVPIQILGCAFLNTTVEEFSECAAGTGRN